MIHEQDLDFALRLLVAVVLGGLIGLERERSHKPAGLRTLMLVSMGAALFAMLGEGIVVRDARGVAQGINSDPTRVVAGIIGGGGFLGAGAIFQAKGSVKGLTTAAGIWITAAIGVAAGLGFFIVAATATALTLITLAVLAPLEDRVNGKQARRATAGGGAGAAAPPGPADDEAEGGAGTHRTRVASSAWSGRGTGV
ncbi:MAG TPA: MgtC/SapB family protein [Phycisphaerales bacterium]|nr:MgtC/SapB family protein [Phycisphaerales bacterium]